MGMRKVWRRRQEDGFTMVEIIAVLVITGIIAMVGLSRINFQGTYSLATEADTLKIYLRYAQFRALGDDKSWGLSFSGNSCTLLRDGAPASCNLPNEATATHTLPSGLTVTGAIVNFDAWGSPGTADITLTLSTGAASQAFTVTRNTGFIP